MSGERDIVWRQTVRIKTPANTTPGAGSGGRVRPGASRRRSPVHSSLAGQSRWFHILRSLLLNRVAIVGFLLCYWFIYLQMTGQETAEQQQPVTTVPRAGQDPSGEQTSAKTTVSRPRPQPPSNLVVNVPQQFRGQIIYEATPPAHAEKVVALTFDDGPWKNHTEQILDILKKENIKSTFYFVGRAIEENPAIAKLVVDQGHALGNHTWRHIMEDMDVATAAEELGNTARLIYQTTGVKTTLMRPPGGNLSGELVNYAKQQGFMVTMWSADSSDYMVSAPLIVDNVLSNTKPGGIILLHDGGGDRSATVEALPQIISALKGQGYKFVTVPELMELQAKWNATPARPPVPATDATAPSNQSPDSAPRETTQRSPEPLSTPPNPAPDQTLGMNPVAPSL